LAHETALVRLLNNSSQNKKKIKDSDFFVFFVQNSRSVRLSIFLTAKKKRWKRSRRSIVNKTEKMVSAKGDSRVQKNKKKATPTCTALSPTLPSNKKNKNWFFICVAVGCDLNFIEIYLSQG
jgi:hypothetical protein